ncbi:MAG TPA: serine hydrolase [Burkholderiales bacterium]
MRFIPVSLIALATVSAPAFAAARSAAQPHEPSLRSQAALVLDQDSGVVLLGKNAESPLPIASLTKLMTAIVTLDADLDPYEPVTIAREDVDKLRRSPSRLKVGATLTRDELLHLALMASENRAASALGRSYPGGKDAIVLAMNLKAQLLGLSGTRFNDATGLSAGNISTAHDLARLVRAAHDYAKIREYSTSAAYQVRVGRRTMRFGNTNLLVRNTRWDIGLSKTGYLSEAGRCLVMQATLAGRSVIIVLLDSWGKYTRVADAMRIRQWLEFAIGRSGMQRPALSPITDNERGLTPAQAVRARPA